MRKFILGAAALVTAALLLLFATLPPGPVRSSLDHVDAALRARTVTGAYHVHTTRSDGGSDPSSVAEAAATAGLQYVIFTDHGDGTRPPEAPRYLHGVLCIDAVEISTDDGHYVALGLGATPYPLGGSAAAVVEDVARLGGFGVAAHPDHPRPQLAWTDWTAPVDGIEWLNADSEWRDEGRVALGRVAVALFMRPSVAIAQTFDRPSRTLDRWDDLSRQRRVVALAAVDAHGRGRARTEAGESRPAIGPSYAASFATVTNRVVLERPLTSDPAQDGRLLLEAIRRGDVYSVVDAISPDVVLNLGAESVVWTAPEGVPSSVEPFRDGPRQRLEVVAERGPGEPPVPWIVTNWVGPAPAVPVPPVAPLADLVPLPLASGWRVESDPASSGRVSGAESLVTFEYRLAAGERRSQFAAAAVDVAPDVPFTALSFRGHAASPMRVSVQLRFRPDDRRWVRSVYLGPEDRDITIPLSTLRGPERRDGPLPPLAMARSILFVVDLVNAAPASAGSFTISDLRVTRAPSAPR